MSNDPADLKRLAEGRWPISWEGGPSTSGRKEWMKVALSLTSGAAAFAFLIGWLVYNLITR